MVQLASGEHETTITRPKKRFEPYNQAEKSTVIFFGRLIVLGKKSGGIIAQFLLSCITNVANCSHMFCFLLLFTLW